MLPKKGRREITVDGVLYHYSISGSISVIIRNSITGEIIKWNEDRKYKDLIPFTPSDVAFIIRSRNSVKTDIQPTVVDVKVLPKCETAILFEKIIDSVKMIKSNYNCGRDENGIGLSADEGFDILLKSIEKKMKS